MSAESSKAYYNKHKHDAGFKAKNRAKSAAHRKAHPEYGGILVKRWRKKNPVKRILATARWRAKERGWQFSITEADIVPLPMHCPVLGIPLRLVSKQMTEI